MHMLARAHACTCSSLHNAHAFRLSMYTLPVHTQAHSSTCMACTAQHTLALKAFVCVCVCAAGGGLTSRVKRCALLHMITKGRSSSAVIHCFDSWRMLMYCRFSVSLSVLCSRASVCECVCCAARKHPICAHIARFVLLGRQHSIDVFSGGT